MEDVRAEAMLIDPNFGATLAMLARITQALLSLIVRVVGLLFCIMEADDMAPRPEVDPAPAPEVEYRLDISP